MTLQLQVGKTYVARNGQNHKITNQIDLKTLICFFDDCGRAYWGDGRFGDKYTKTPHDLISEVTPVPLPSIDDIVRPDMIDALLKGQQIQWFNGVTEKWVDLYGGADAMRFVLRHTGKQYRIKPVHKWQKEMDAQAAGKKIQIRHPGAQKWDDAYTEFKFTDATSEYRVKPDPVTKEDAMEALEATIRMGRCEATEILMTFIEEQA